ncbi:ABC transporter substrate-binding protein [Ketogulonicigenium vulgare]|uniref:ABC-type nitrate/sulfonate/bicarbonate transport systems periplasmic components-like protein n=1 Tax=Ketogulonicigenium vulgare (strain WSH-001) TaxID=759362 RepID=F9Y8C6_KETVW|nr:ABC transporter substrate-binding protein [Ketogulonicigenium vulgare]ADO41699.1 ABC transporter, periplasmic substrate binding protein [Ketogulonicigenium vulgare Y25]AEM39935.1 ABC-type nitrate/sulfonate/bicarbonate transport systems periplasmic components-like protein [Ketogulonicigenium vulgare WSH-001]ALJ82228.1 ABC transporter substrate-binding protein [Ketogulonicigenium vulgare]ANW34881.1 ABC transporter substrate-binding protein [Ketogulonicigenium vulgare]AOZ53630.1 ABC transporte
MFHSGKAAIAAAVAAVIASGAAAQTAMPFTLDWRFEGPAAPYFLALDNGYFTAEGLDVTIAEGVSSLDAIPKVATGAFPVGFADINSLVRFLDQNPGAPVTAVMMIYDKPSFAMVGRKSLGIEVPTDIQNHTLGAPPPDGGWAQFPIFAAVNGIDMSTVTVDPVGFPVREPMLAEGNVDAVTGFSFSVKLNLMRLGIPEDDISVLLMADYGVDLYGNAIIVNTDFAAENPEAVTGFLRAVATGFREAAADPAAAVDALIIRNPAADAALETTRLEMALNDNVMTEWVMANGFGGIDPARLDSAIEQTTQVYEFVNSPDASLYFDAAFLPTDGSLNMQ